MAGMRAASLLAVFAVAAALSTASGVGYTVGEPGGSWDLQTNYTAWASSITFRLGDQLVFKYSPAAHDVVEVSKAGYDSCSASTPIASFRTGNDVIQLGRLGMRYFICGVPGHCAVGMKLQVRVMCDIPSSPPGANGAPGVNGAPAGICLDGSTPTTIMTPGVISYNSAPGSSRSVCSALGIAATAMVLISLIV